MSTISSNPAYSGALSILSSSPTDTTTNATDDTESAGQKLVDIAKNATSGQGTTSSTTSTNPQDTVSLSDDAKVYLAAQSSSTTSSTNSDANTVYNLLAQNGSPQLREYQEFSQSYGKDFADAVQNKTLNVTNANDIPGLDVQIHNSGGLTYTTTNTAVQAQYEQEHPASMLIVDYQTGNAYYIQPQGAAAQAATVAYAQAQPT